MGALAVVASLFGSAALLASAPPAGASSASAAVLPSLTVQGFGFGHGRGMGQWGAFGYASAYHWSYQQILAHYYGGTKLGRVQRAGTEIPVLLSELQGRALKVVAPPGQQLTAALPGGGSVVAAALEVAWRAGAPWVYTGTSCSGAWHPAAKGAPLVGGASAAATTTVPLASGPVVSIFSTAQASGGGAGSRSGAGTGAAGTGPVPAATTSTTGATVSATASGLVDVCLPRLGAREYAGRVLAEPDGKVFDVLPLEQYVDGVVPAESPETWAAHGGEAALEAQAVAARSYALALLVAQGYVCDNTQCQMFVGVPDQYGPTADAAVAATAGQVLYCLPATTCGPAGSVALTEYSASTGGYTAGGAFPAVVDQGDAVRANPVHSWAFTLTAAQLGKAFPSLGGVTGASVTARNGLGAMGGRVVSVTVFGRKGQMTLAGYRFAALLGLPSDWFSVGGAASPATSVPATTGPAATTTTRPAPTTTTRPTTKTTRPAATTTVPPTTTTGRTTTTAPAPATTAPATTAPATTAPATTGPATGASTTAVPNATGTTGGTAGTGGTVGTPSNSAPNFSYWVVTSRGNLAAGGKAPLLGTALGTSIQGNVAGMAAAGRIKGYWLASKDGGVLAFGHAQWYGSASGHHLRAPVVAMTATPDGHGYWLVSRDGGVFAFGDARFFGSVGATSPGEPVVGMARTPDGGGYWLVTSTGGVFPFGDAGFYGSPSGRALARPITGLVPAPGGKGYFLIARDGGVFAYGSAKYAGSLPAQGIRALVVAVAQAPHGGYVMMTADGALFEFSRAGGGSSLQTAMARAASLQGSVAIALDHA